MRGVLCVAVAQGLLLCGGLGGEASGRARGDDGTSALIARIEKHQAAIANLTFVCEVESNLPSPLSPAGGKPQKTREFFRLARPPANEPHDSFAWEIQSEVEKGRFRTKWFRVTDGTTDWGLSVRVRKAADGKAEVVKNRGFIDACKDNHVWTYNVFARMLFMEVDSSWKAVNPPKRSRGAQTQFQITGKTTFLDRPALVLERKHPSTALLYRTTVLDEPQAMVLRFQTLGSPGNRALADYRVEQIKTIAETAYPAKGSYEAAESKGRYTFTVDQVIPAKDYRDGWYPVWPPGTTVADIVNGREFETKGGEKVTPGSGRGGASKAPD